MGRLDFDVDVEQLLSKYEEQIKKYEEQIKNYEGQIKNYSQMRKNDEKIIANLEQIIEIYKVKCKSMTDIDDVISRQAVLEHREVLRDEQGTGYQAVKTKYIRQLPSVTPQEPQTDRIEYGTDGNLYKLTITNGKEYEQEPKTCEKCLYAEETDGSHCYECVKGESRFEPQTGHWEWLTEDKYRCSNCNHETRVDECMNEPMYDFCPFCGCRMSEVSE